METFLKTPRSKLINKFSLATVAVFFAFVGLFGRAAHVIESNPLNL